MYSHIEAFGTHLSSTESPRTAAKYLSDVAVFERIRAGRPTTLDVYEEWVRLESSRVRPQTVARKAAAVRRWLAFLARHGDEDAFRSLTVLQAGYQVLPPVRQTDVKTVAVLTKEEYDAARAIAKPRWAAPIMSLLWWTGARASEIVGDLISGIPYLTLVDGISLTSTGYIETVGKGGKRRVLILPTAGRRVLTDWIGLGRTSSFPRERRGGRGGVTSREYSDALFPSARRSSISYGAVHRAFVLAGAGHPHRFRHAYKARLRQAGVGDEVQRALMGHGPRSVTDRYGRVSLSEMLDAAEKLMGCG